MDEVEHIICIILVVAVFILGLFIGNVYGPKFCPVCGEEYGKEVSYCKYDGTELIMKGEH
jgi:hypothetical protein